MIRKIWPVLFLCLGQIFLTATASAQERPYFSFDSFRANYYLDRDAKKRSVLVTDETLVVNFPLSGESFWGLFRVLPKEYVGSDLDIKVTNVTDDTGRALPYKTSSDKDDNFVIEAGDRAVTLFGTQTFKISYQTRNVVNSLADKDELLLNVNGRGWQQKFNEVSGFLNISKSLKGELLSEPECYVGYFDNQLKNCEIKKEDKDDNLLVSARTSSALTANQSLVMKLAFKKDTFAKTTKASKMPLLVGAGVLGGFATLMFVLAVIFNKRASERSGKPSN